MSEEKKVGWCYMNYVTQNDSSDIDLNSIYEGNSYIITNYNKWAQDDE